MKKPIISSLSLTFLLTGATINGNGSEPINIATLGPVTTLLNVITGTKDVSKMLEANSEYQTALSALKNSNISEELKNKILANIQEDISELKIAAGFTITLQLLDKILKNLQLDPLREYLKEFKYSAQTNIMHKFLMGIIPGRFASKDN